MVRRWRRCHLGEEEREELERWARRPKTAHALALRVRIVLRVAAGGTNTEAADELGVTKQTVGSRIIGDALERAHDDGFNLRVINGPRNSWPGLLHEPVEPPFKDWP